MKREIKFKGWNGKRMTREYTLNEMLVEQLENNGLKENWLQYTGIKDKNSKDIYDGDIIEDQNKDLWEVYFDMGSFLLKNKLKKSFTIPVTLYQEPIVEIIGNIYQNKDLLNG